MKNSGAALYRSLRQLADSANIGPITDARFHYLDLSEGKVFIPDLHRHDLAHHHLAGWEPCKLHALLPLQ